MAISAERDSRTSQAMTAAAEDAVIEALRDLARWLYRQLERDRALTLAKQNFADNGVNAPIPIGDLGDAEVHRR